jgi:hypothetical protein
MEEETRDVAELEEEKAKKTKEEMKRKKRENKKSILKATLNSKYAMKLRKSRFARSYC